MTMKASHKQRPLFLHYSALAPEELLFAGWLQQLLPPSGSSPIDEPALDLEVRVDDVGLFLLERLGVEEEIWEDILSFFRPSHTSLQPRYSSSQSHLRSLPPLQVGQVLVVFRLVAHACAARDARFEGIDLAFRQANSPSDLLHSPSPDRFRAYLAKKHTKPPLPPQHLNRRQSAHQKPVKETASGTPPPSPPRRTSNLPPKSPSSQELIAPPRRDPFTESPQDFARSDYLRKITHDDDDDSSSSPSSSSDEDDAENRYRPDERSQSVTSSNPFRSRLQSVPYPQQNPTPLELCRTKSAGQDPVSSFTPPLPPRPATNSRRTSAPFAPPLPARDLSRQPHTHSSASSRSDPRGALSSQSQRQPPPPVPSHSRKPSIPSRPPKPAELSLGVASAFKTTALIHQSLAAAEDARREAVNAPDKTTRIEVIGSSSSPSKDRGSSTKMARTRSGSSGRDGLSGSGSASKWGTINAPLGLGRPVGKRTSLPVAPSLVHQTSRSTSMSTPAYSPATVTSDDGHQASYPFPIPGQVSAFDAPPPPPIRRNSSLSKPTSKPPSTSTNPSVSRHASLSSRISGRSASGMLRPEDLRETFEHSIKVLHSAAEEGVDRFRQSRKGVPVDAQAWRTRGRGDRERLMDDDDDRLSAGEGDSADEERRELRRESERSEGYRQLG